MSQIFTGTACFTLTFFKIIVHYECFRFSTNLLMLGKTYLRLNNKEKAIAYLTRARDYAIASSEDLEVNELTFFFILFDKMVLH